MSNDKKVASVNSVQCIPEICYNTSKQHELSRQIEELIGASRLSKRSKKGVLGKLITAIFTVNGEEYRDIETL